MSGCAKEDEGHKIPEDHPAAEFYEMASRLPISSDDCAGSEGQIDLSVADVMEEKGFRTVKSLAEGAFVTEEVSTGKNYLIVRFMQRGLVSIPKICHWDWEEEE